MIRDIRAIRGQKSVGLVNFLPRRANFSEGLSKRLEVRSRDEGARMAKTIERKN
jgi:hypothetical protein